MLQATPMDDHGNFTFGLMTSHISDMPAKAKGIIVEVNKNLPWDMGLTGSEINIKNVDTVVKGDNPLVARLDAAAYPTPSHDRPVQAILCFTHLQIHALPCSASGNDPMFEN